MRKSTSLLILVSMLFTAHIATAQEWQPEHMIWEASFSSVISEPVPGVPYLTIFNMPSATDDVGMFRIDSLSDGAQPYVHGLPIKYIIHSLDLNGNGIPDVSGPSLDEHSRQILILDAFSEEEKVAGEVVRGNIHINAGARYKNVEDLDHDGQLDFLSYDRVDARVSFGDDESPFSTWNVVNPIPSNGSFQIRRFNMVMVGILDDEPHMLTWVEYGPNSNIRTKYQLLSLNQEDLDSRADTVQTSVVYEIEPNKVNGYHAPVFFSDSVWWVGAIDGATPTMLKITLSGYEERRPAQSYNLIGDRNIYGPFLHGQDRKLDQFPFAIDMDRPILESKLVLIDGERRILVEYSHVTSSDSLSREYLGATTLLPSREGLPTVYHAALLGDLDGDGLDDFMVNYKARNPTSGHDQTVSTIYLTTSRPTVTVSQRDSPKPLDFPPCTFSNAPAFIYNVLGEVVATVDIVDNQIALHQLEALPQQPLWVVQGECVRRVR